MTTINFIISGNIQVRGITPEAFKEIHKTFTIPNPKYEEAVKYDRYTGDLDPTLQFYAVKHTRPPVAELPRGAAKIVHDILFKYGDVKILDNRLELPEMDFTFKGSLRPYQQQAVNGILSKHFGVLESGTGSGKTVMGLAVIAARKQPTLIIVHTKELLYQWRDRTKSFLNVDSGLIGDGKFDIQPITIAIVNSAKKHLSELVDRFGHIVVDECHRTPSTTFTEVIKAFPAKYMLGLSATPFRRDGLDNLIGWYLGTHRVSVDMAVLQETKAVLRPKIINRPTSFKYWYDNDYQGMISSLVQDDQRNRLIASDIKQQAKSGGLSLVVSDRVNHLQELSNLVNIEHQLLTGKTSPKKRREIVETLEDGNTRILFSTLSLIGEGFDCPDMDSLFITTPVKFKGRIQQVVGRILRPSEGKQPLVYDYQDNQVPILMYQAKSRQKTFATL